MCSVRTLDRSAQPMWHQIPPLHAATMHPTLTVISAIVHARIACLLMVLHERRLTRALGPRRARQRVDAVEVSRETRALVRRLLGLSLLILLIVSCGGGSADSTASSDSPAVTSSRTSSSEPTRLSSGGTASPIACQEENGADLRLVDKERGLSPDDVPTDLVRIDDQWAAPGFPGQSLRQPAADALVGLLEAAEAAGHELRIRSTYRSYEEQIETFNYWVNRLGEVQARRESAPAGHSEHQLGTTADLSSREVGWDLIPEFAETPEGQWLAENAHEYGFALSYPPDSEAVTGYVYEPWHIRYIGVDCAAKWKASGLLLIRFLPIVDRDS